MAGEVSSLTFAVGVSVTAPTGSTPMTNPMTTQGDIIKGGSSGTPERLAIGTAGKFLSNDGSDAAWLWNNVHSVSSANYTVLDNDGYHVILVTTGSSNRTIGLPTAADNTGRALKIMKADTGTGDVVVDGEASELQSGSNFYLTGQYESVTVVCDGTNWYPIESNLFDVIESTVARGSAVTLTTATDANVTSITVPPGKWDIYSAIGFDPNGTTDVTLLAGGVATTSATMPSIGTLASPSSNEMSMQFSYRDGDAGGTVQTHDHNFALLPYRAVATGSLTLYLVANATFTVDALKAYGTLTARRAG